MMPFKMTPKRLALTFGGLVLLLGAVLFGTGWYFSIQIEDDVLRVKHEPEKYEIEVVALEDDRVKLRFSTEEELRKQPETMGLKWPDGYARAGKTLEIGGSEVLREYTQLEGALAVGDWVRFDKFAYPGDPARAHEIPFEEIQFPSPLGARSLGDRRIQ